MIAKLGHWWQATRTSFWFIPGVIVLGAAGLAAGLIAVDAEVELHLEKRWPLVFGAGASGARGLLSSVAGSMITVAGVVFSITIVALTLTSSQYTSRVLRNFMGDRLNQVVLGVFLGIFAYCLVVLRTIRGGEEGAFVPSLAVLGGLILAFVGIAFLILFIHHIARSIQASSIIAAAAHETIEAVDQLYPHALGHDVNEETDGLTVPPEERTWSVVSARRTGYIESIDGNALLAWAQEHETILRMERGLGEFIVEGSPLLSISGPYLANEKNAAELNEIYFVSHQRTVESDAGFGIRQIVDIAMKALSPGINDTTTAVMCIDYLGAILVRLADRGIAAAYRAEEGAIRVIARGASFETLLAKSFDQIRQNADGNVAVLTRQLEALETVAGRTTNVRRRKALRQQRDLIAAVAERSIASQYDGAGIRAALQRLAVILQE